MTSFSDNDYLRGTIRWLKKFFASASKRGFRGLVLLGGLLSLFLLVYFRAWLPLQEEVGLPVGVSASAAQINSSLIQRIQAERAERSGKTVRSFPAAERILVERQIPPS